MKQRIGVPPSPRRKHGVSALSLRRGHWIRTAASAALLTTVVGGLALAPGSLGAPIVPTAAASLGQTLRTSGEPGGVALDLQRGRAYVTDPKENTLYVFDLATGDPVAYIPTGREPNQVVVSGDRAFVSNFADESVTMVDATTSTAVATLSVGGLGLAFNPTTKRVYAAGASRVAVLDASTGKEVASLAAPSGARPWGLAVDPITSRIFATDLANPRVLVYDGVRNTLMGEVAIPAPARFAIALGPLSRVYVAGDTDRSPQLTVIDGVSLSVLSRAPTRAFTPALVVDGNGLAYSAATADGAIAALDVSAGVSTTVPVTARAGAYRGPRSSTAVAMNYSTGTLVAATAGGSPPPPRLFGDGAPVVKP